jgi:hypothetical protein
MKKCLTPLTKRFKFVLISIEFGIFGVGYYQNCGGMKKRSQALTKRFDFDLTGVKLGTIGV